MLTQGERSEPWEIKKKNEKLQRKTPQNPRLHPRLRRRTIKRDGLCDGRRRAGARHQRQRRLRAPLRPQERLQSSRDFRRLRRVHAHEIQRVPWHGDVPQGEQQNRSLQPVLGKTRSEARGGARHGRRHSRLSDDEARGRKVLSGKCFHRNPRIS